MIDDFDVTVYAMIEMPIGNVFYVGVTRQPLKNRLQNHLNYQCISKLSTYLYQSGKSGNFIEIFELDKTTLQNASFYEEFYIHLFCSFGFNLIQHRTSDYTKQQTSKQINRTIQNYPFES